MKILQDMKRRLAMAAVCMGLIFAAVPAQPVYAAAVQPETETQAAQAVGTAEAAEAEDDGFMMIIMGGGLLIVIFAVVTAMATVSSAACVAANMDVDGE